MGLRVKTDGENILAIGKRTDDFGEVSPGQVLVDVTNKEIPPAVFTDWILDAVTKEIVRRQRPITETMIKAMREPDGLINLLKDRLHEYIFSHYDPHVQASMQCLYADPRGSKKAKEDITAAWDWARSVLDYYYQQKARLEAGETWQVFGDLDFEQFDKSDPGVTLRGLLKEGKS